MFSWFRRVTSQACDNDEENRCCVFEDEESLEEQVIYTFHSS